MKLTAGTGQRRPLKPSVGFDADDGSNDSETEDAPRALTGHDEHQHAVRAMNLKDEGCALAESGDLQGALNAWHKGLELDPSNYVMWELKAQVYLELDLHLQAVQAAEKAVEINPNWGIGFQTLARCQREVGEVCLSLQSYQNAARLLPDDRDVETEHNEVAGLSTQLHQMRLERLQAMNGCSVNSPQHEATSCLYHLSARASGIVHAGASNSSEVVDSDQNNMRSD